MSPNINQNTSSSFKVAIVAGEESGDQLGGSLIKQLKKLTPSISYTFIGVGGNKMQQEGLNSFFDMERISVMGLIDPLLRIKELLQLRKELKNFLIKESPDIFIGIDSPDFNLPISKDLKGHGIKTVQYVSPTIWAWRQGRLKTIEKSVDTVMNLFPFENKAYESSSVTTAFVGHPLAHKIPKKINKQELKEERFSITNKKMVALLPGSRKSEIKKMSPLFIDAAKLIKLNNPNICFYMPLTDLKFKEFIKGHETLDWINFSEGNSQEVLSAADLAIVTSGTASLEAALFRTPSVVAYKTNWITYLLLKPFLKINIFALPNLLAEKEIFPELIQSDVTKYKILEAFNNIDKNREKLLKEIDLIHSLLESDGPQTAARTITQIL